MEQRMVKYHDTDIQVREDGEIRDRGFVRKHRINADGYPVVSVLTPNGSRSVGVHILMAMAFVPNDDPEHKIEVNHKDFDRTNWHYDNLEWVTHYENIQYSSKAGRHARLYGKDNPNYGNNILHKRYIEDKSYAKEKQSRPRGRNGRAKKCSLENYDLEYYFEFDCQRDAVDYLIEIGRAFPEDNKESIIKLLKRPQGYLGWHLIQI